MSNNIQKILLVVLLCSISVIFASSLFYRIANPNLVTVRQSSPMAMQGEPNMGAMIGALMQQVQANPNDLETIIILTETFLNNQDFANAEIFAKKAQLVEPSAFLPQYLLAIAMQGQNKNQEAAVLLENLVAVNDDISARYSLGMIYIYYLNDKAKGKEHLEKAMSAPSISGDDLAEIQKIIQEELAKL